MRTGKERVWNTAEWRRRRDLWIGDSCELCGSSEGPMVVQHLWYRWDRNSVHNELMHVLTPTVETIYRETGTCPKCSGGTIYYRKRAEDWRCSSKKNRRVCGHVFSDPIPGRLPDWDATRAARAEARETTFNARAEEIKAAVAGFLDWQHERYMRFENCETWCKRCAARADLWVRDYVPRSLHGRVTEQQIKFLASRGLAA